MPTDNKTIWTEADLVASALPSLYGQFADRGELLAVERELAVGTRIPDVIYLVQTKPPGPLPKRSLTVRESAALWMLQRDSRCNVEVLKRCGVSDRSLAELIAWGLVRNRTTHYERVPRSLSGLDLVAVEAKLTKWRDALQQARESLAYADFAYVLMPQESAGPALDSRRTFKEAGVGLLMFAAGTIKQAVRAARAKNSGGWERPYVLSRLLSRHFVASSKSFSQS